MKHFLIVEDEQHAMKDLISVLSEAYPNDKLSTAFDCDKGFQILNSSKVTNPVGLLIIDLSFRRQPPGRVLIDGQALMAKLLELKINIPRLVYSSHDEIRFVHPVMAKYNPEGYVFKTKDSTDELLIATRRILDGHRYYSQGVHEEQKGRFEFVNNLDKTDMKIIELLPFINSIDDWHNHFQSGKIPIQYKAILKRLKKIYDIIDVENDKQLLLKLQQMAII